MIGLTRIVVGQEWRRRDGSIVRVTADRQDFALVPRWRWALSDSTMTDDFGRSGHDPNRDDPKDLVERVFGKPSDDAVKAMDDTLPRLPGDEQ